MLWHHVGRGGARISIGITAIITRPRCSSAAPVQEQWLFGGFQSGFNVPLPLILPGRVLSSNGEVRDIFPHLDEPNRANGSVSSSIY